MQSATKSNFRRVGTLALAATFGLGLAGCGGMPTNNTLYSVKQPLVERENFTLDVATSSGGLAVSEQARLNDWFQTMDLRYGDRVAVEDPGSNPAVANAVSDLAARYGMIISETAPTTAGFLQPGQARVVITRTSAEVPGCPDWSESSDMNYTNGTSANFGCANNANLAAMVADPEDLLQGKTSPSETTVSTATKAIEAYRKAPPTGAAGLREANTGGN